MNVTDVPSQMIIVNYGDSWLLLDDKRTRWLEMGIVYILLNIGTVDLVPKYYLYGLTISLKI
jgi:hypothetical protein